MDTTSESRLGHYRPDEVLIVDFSVPMKFKDKYCETFWQEEYNHFQKTKNQICIKQMNYARRTAKLIQLLLSEGAPFEEALFLVKHCANLEDLNESNRHLAMYYLLDNWKYANELAKYVECFYSATVS